MKKEPPIGSSAPKLPFYDVTGSVQILRAQVDQLLPALFMELDSRLRMVKPA